VEVRLFGIAMVKGLLLAFEGLRYGAARGWEGISYAASVMWETIKFAFDKSIAVIKGKFGDMVVSIGRGMSSIPGLKDESAEVVAYGEALKKSAAATEDWSARMARITADHDKRVAAMKADNKREVGTINTVTDAMASEEIMKEAAKKAKAQAVPVGKDMVAGVTQGIEEGSPEAVAAMTSLVKRLEDSARKESETHSPSQKMARFGRDYIDGLVLGLNGRMEERKDEIAEIARKTAELLTPKPQPVKVSVVDDQRYRRPDGKFGESAIGDEIKDLQEKHGPFAAAMLEYQRTVGAVGDNMRQAFGRAFKGMEDALVNFVKTGKLNFKDLARSIIDDLIRIQIQQSITKPLASAMQSFDFSSLKFWADGGVPGGPSVSAWRNQVVNQPTLFAFAKGAGVMGEAGPEAIMPLTRGADGRLGVQAQGGAGNVTIEQHITVNAQGADAGVEQKIYLAMQRAKQEAVAAVADSFRRGGPMARAVRMA
jgi:hypothetical protein